MYYSKQIYSPTRKLKKVISRFLGVRGNKAVDFASQYSPKIEQKVQDLIPVVRMFLGNNWLAMLKTSFTVLTLLVFSYAMIYAENFQAYDTIANGSGLDEQSVKTNSDVAINLESVVIDESDDIGPRRITYTVKRGDTPSGIASQFGITTKNLKSVNNLTSDRLKVGSKLIITPVEGFVIQNTAGDMTVEQFAKKHLISIDDLKELNDFDSDLNVIKNGDELFIALTPEEGRRLGFIAPEPVAQPFVAKTSEKTVANSKKVGGKKTTTITTVVKKTTKGYYSAKETASYMGFAKGNCTAFVARKRPDIGKAIRLAGGGHAKTRLGQAKKAGLATGKKPIVGAVAVQPGGGNGYGHVGIVTSFDDDEVCLNNANVNGYGVVSQNCFSRSSVGGYIY